MTEATELKPCPFCYHSLISKGGLARCETTGCWMSESMNAIPVDSPLMVDRWNTRAFTQAGASLTAAQNAGPVMLKALRMISYSIKQANIPGNDWKRELRLIENLALAAIAQAQGPE
jgi:hypothetical protein